MTTKKQRREQTAEKTRLAREALAAENLEALKRSKHKAEQARWEKERAENKKKAAQAMKDMAKDKETPDNLLASAQALDNAILRSGRADHGLAQNMSSS
jgi:hypothetical protein